MINKILFSILSATLLCAACNTVENNCGAISEDREITSIKVDGEEIPVHVARVSKWPTNKFWDGHQRDLEETETAFFSSFDYKPGQTVSVNYSGGKVKNCVVRPSNLGIEAKVSENGRIELNGIPGPCQFVVEMDGHHRALHLFVNPSDSYADVNKEDPNVIYYGPGEYDCGRIELKSNQTLFIDKGAVVYGCVHSDNTSNVKIIGNGILDCSKMVRSQGQAIAMNYVTGAEISGITINDPAEWSIRIADSDQFLFDNVKIIGAWRYNADGIDICNTCNVKVQNCFLRCFDDNIVIKGLSPFYVDGHKIIENIDVSNCVLWNDWGQALEIGAETVADEIRHVNFDSCFVIHSTFNAMDIQNTDMAHVHDIHYSNIYVEEPIYENAALCDEPMSPSGFGGVINITINPTRYSTTETCGRVSDVTYDNIFYTGAFLPKIKFSGYSSAANIKDIKVSNCYFNGKRIGKNYNYTKNQFVSNITIE